jgi:NADH-quinone oxidoreductase subunit H
MFMNRFFLFYPSDFFEVLVRFLLLLIPLLLSVAYLTLVERKVMAGMQRRKGPNVVGLFGLLQPLADGLKLFLKETILPRNSNKLLFIFAPMLTFILSIVIWTVIPFGPKQVVTDPSLGVLYILAISSLGVYGIIIAGWASNSQYSFLGALRSAAQMISYEVAIGFILATVIACTGTMNLSKIVEFQSDIWFLFPLLPSALMFFVSVLAETNRHPFDLPEAEAELVAGYNVEYSAMGFALFFLGEYSNMISMSAIFSTLFLGGWKPFFFFNLIPINAESSLFTFFAFFSFSLKIIFLLFLFIAIRAALPRYRYDQLMTLGWKVFLPFSLGWLMFICGILVSFDWLVF